MSKLRVCVDARLPGGGSSGGTEQVIIGLASGLSRLTDGDEEYLFLVHGDSDEWIRPYVRGPCEILRGPVRPRAPRWKQRIGANVPIARSAWHGLKSFAGHRATEVPRSDGTIEKAGVDVVHFASQEGSLTNIPSIYHPHDLQHLHLPEYFAPKEVRRREVTYRAFCEQAQMISVVSSWGKQDLIQHYKLPKDKVWVVPLAPMLTAYPSPSNEDLASTLQKFLLPETFVFYPAQTWAHKNHIALLEALAILRRRYRLRIPFVSSGRTNEFFPTIQRRARELLLTDQAWFLGFVTPLELQCLYRLCHSIIVPSKFEAASFPLWEAFLSAVPAACSNVTSLPDQAGDAALIFDPDRPEEIANAVRRLWTDEALCNNLVERGKNRVARFTWDRTARTFRAHYRRIANCPLTEQDRSLLSSPPLL